MDIVMAVAELQYVAPADRLADVQGRTVRLPLVGGRMPQISKSQHGAGSPGCFDGRYAESVQVSSETDVEFHSTIGSVGARVCPSSHGVGPAGVAVFQCLARSF